MGTLHTFRPRLVSPARSPADMRAQIEEAAQAALDQANALILILDRIDRDADREEAPTDYLSSPLTALDAE